MSAVGYSHTNKKNVPHRLDLADKVTSMRGFPLALCLSTASEHYDKLQASDVEDVLERALSCRVGANENAPGGKAQGAWSGRATRA